MRTTKDLVEELAREGKDAYYAAIIIGFPQTTEFVHWSKAEESNQLAKPLRELNEVVGRGGEPVGICVAKQSKKRPGAKTQLTVSIRPLKEYAEDEHLKKYLTRLSGLIEKNLRAMIGDDGGEISFDS